MRDQLITRRSDRTYDVQYSSSCDTPHGSNRPDPEEADYNINSADESEDLIRKLDKRTTTSSNNKRTWLVVFMALYMMGWFAICLSWVMLYYCMFVGAKGTGYQLLGYTAVLLSCVGYTVWGLLAKHGPPQGSLRDHCGVLFHSIRHRGLRLRPYLRGTTKTSFPIPSLSLCLRYGLILLPSLTLFMTFTYIGISPDSHIPLSDELRLWIAKMLWDAVVAYMMTAILLVQVTSTLTSRSPPVSDAQPPDARRRWRVSAPTAVAMCIIVCVSLLLGVSVMMHVRGSQDAMDAMRGTVLGEPGPDFCEAYGMQLDPARLRGGWVLPSVLPRRFFNFYLGSETCRNEGHVQLGFIDEELNQLVVPARCPPRWLDSLFIQRAEVPRVFLETPNRNQLDGGIPGEFKKPNDRLLEMLEEKYAGDDTVIVHRSRTKNKSSKAAIASIEMQPKLLTSQLRVATSENEKRIRSGWGGDDKEVFIIQLGRSLTYTVRCDGSSMEDYFIYPLSPTELPNSESTEVSGGHLLLDGSSSTTGDADEPPANVLIFAFDAVSRPEVLRSLPKFVAWLREFKMKGASSGGTHHRVLEARSHTTVGSSTMGNFGPLLSGNALIMQNHREVYQSPIDFSNRTIFWSVKERYGSRVQTSLNSGLYHDFIETIFGRTETTAGYGDAAGGVDQNMFGPLCHAQYAGRLTNVRGSYSMEKRCIGSFQVHEHLLLYTKALMRQRLQEIMTRINTPTKQRGRFFFDLTYFIEGHEATHGVLALVDKALTNFMEELHVELRFFDDPRNAVVLLSDHGNHMGQYYEWFEAGKLEKAMPFLVFIIHPETFRRVDNLHGWAAGSSEAAMAQRVQNVTTQADLYMTLCDLVGVEPHLAPSLERAPTPPQSMFNPLTASGHGAVLMQLHSRAIAADPMIVRTPLCTNWCAEN